jgi:signal transduction histidine kinase
VLHGLPEKLLQLFTRRLSNAIKFADMSTSERRITVELELSPSPAIEGPCIPPFISETEIFDWTVPKPVYIFVSVQDSGPGLKPDDLALLFKRYVIFLPGRFHKPFLIFCPQDSHKDQ